MAGKIQVIETSTVSDFTIRVDRRRPLCRERSSRASLAYPNLCFVILGHLAAVPLIFCSTRSLAQVVEVAPPQESHRAAATPSLYQPIPLESLERSAAPQPPAPPLEITEVGRRSSPMTLDEAWQEALVADGRLQAADAEQQAAAHLTAAAEAEYRPSLKLNAAYELRTDELAYRIMPPIAPVPIDQPFMQREFFEFGAQLRVPLYTGGRLAHGVEAAAHGAHAAGAERETRLLDLRYRVAQEYVGVLRAQDERTVARTYLDNLKAHLADVRALHREGRAPRNDVLSAEVAVSDAEHTLVVATHGLDAARAAYNRRLGRPLATTVDLKPLQFRPFRAELESATEKALSYRPELARLASDVAALCHRSEQARAARKAQVYAEGVYGFRENQYQDPQGIGAVRLGVDWNLVDFGRSEHRAESLAWRSQAMQRRFDHLASTIRLQVRRAWLHLDETRHRVEVAQNALGQADENARVTRSRYKNGLATNTDVLGAELLRVRTYRNYNHALYDAILAVMWFERVTGGWEEL